MIVITFDEEIEIIKKTFSLEGECINFEHSNIYAEDWNEDKNCWEVEYIDQVINYSLIHELGHIYLAKKLEFPYFAKTSREIKEKAEEIKKLLAKRRNLPNDLKEISDIFDYVNYIVDCFVNSNSFSSNQYYLLYLEYIDRTLRIIKNGFRFTNLHELLGGYITNYLEFNFNLKFKNKTLSRQKKINIFIRDLKKIIINNSNLTNEKFQEINKKLNYFNKIKNTTNPKDIIKFIFEIIKLVAFWNEVIIRKKFKLFFPETDFSFI